MNWLRVQMAVFDSASAIAGFAVNWLLQSTLLIAAGLIVVWLARRRGAAVQSAIYRTTLAAVIVCPLATLLLSLSGVSGWSLRMPVAWEYEELKSVDPGVAMKAHVFETQRDFDDAVSVSPSPPLPLSPSALRWRDARELASPDLPAVEGGGSGGPALAPGAPGVPPYEEPKPAALAPDSASLRVRSFGWVAAGIALTWLIGAAFLLARLTIVWGRLSRLVKVAAPAEPAAQEACRQAATLVGVFAPKVMRSPYLASPCVVGWPRSAILLPEADPALPLRDVLIHELAHLRRGDAGWKLLGRLAESLFFYQPLVWLLHRRLESSAEDVCDDYVVQFGGDRSQYARGLLEIAALSTTPVAATAVAIVSLRSILARRVTRIMDSSRSLSTRAGNLLLVIVITGGLLGATVVGFVGLAPQPAAEAEPPPAAAKADDDRARDDAGHVAEKPTENEKRANAASVAEKAKPPGNEKQTADSELRGTVIGSDGKPVADAKLFWIRSRVHDVQPPKPQLLASTGKDGQYRFTEPAAVDPTIAASWSYMDRIAVVAPGHGFTFTSPEQIRRDMSGPDGLIATLASLVGGRDNSTALPAAGEPIRGRLVDVNGRPVAGATVHIRWFNGDKDIGFAADLEARGAENPVWQARVMNLLNVIEPVQLRDVLPSATTDADGRFELRDIGPKRLLQLLVQGDGIEATEIVARNEPGEKMVIKSNRHERGDSFTVYPNDFVYAVGPSKPVAGRVLDFDTGEPIAGAVVRAFQVQNEQVSTSREREHFAATTDAQGRYRITGLPIGKGNKLVALALGDVAYIPVAHSADTSGTVAAVEQDFRLKRGVWAEGRVFDAESDKPFTGEISYYAFRNRELEDAIPGLREAYVDGLYWTNANGEFRVPVLPSRGILGFRYDGFDRQRDAIDRFPRGLGAAAIAGAEKLGTGKMFPTLPFYLIPENYERVAEVAPSPGQETIRVDMPLFASPPVTVRVEALGEPVTKFDAYGNERWQWQPHEGPEFEIQDLRPGERRKVFVFHRWRNLAGGGFVEYGTKQVVRIDMVKAGSVKGRLVDADGEPIDDAMLLVNYEKLRSDDNSAIWAQHPNLAANPTKIPVDKDGRFRLDGLIPGWTYHAYASAPRPYENRMMDRVIGSPLKDVQVKAGEVKDLGDLVVTDDKAVADNEQKDVSFTKPITNGASEPPQPALEKQTASEEKEYHGKVVAADGQPLAGAEIWLAVSPYDHVANTVQSTLRRVAVSDVRGDFAFRFKPVENSEQFPLDWRQFASIVAKAPGHGCDWLPLAIFERDPVLSEERIQLEKNIDKALGEGRFAGRTLKLPREVGQVRGRLVDLEGHPLKGVTVSVESIQNPDMAILRKGFAEASRDTVNEALRARWTQAWLNRRIWQALVPPVKTDDNGRFSLTGLGRDQVATVTLSGDRVEAERFFILGTEMQTMRVPHISVYTKGAQDSFVGVNFSLAVGPAIPVSGVVTEFKTGKPIAGATVYVERLFSRESLDGSSVQLRLWTNHIRAVTDEQGRYRLLGIPPGEAHVLNAIPPKSEPWLIASQTISLDPGQPSATVDIQVFRGIWIEGKVTDADTGEATEGRVDYLALRTNKNIPQEFGLTDGWEMGRFPIGAGGRYRTAGLPGPGVLLLRSSGKKTYPLSVGAEEIEGYDAKGNYLLTTPTGYPLSNWNLVRFINPSVDAESYHCDLTLSAGASLVGRVVGPNDAPGASIEAMGLVEKNGFFEPLKDDKFTVTDYRPDVPRNLFFRTTDQSLIGYLHLEGKPAADLTVRLQASVTVRGRLIETETEDPAAGYALYCDSSKQGAFRIADTTTDKEGRFEIKGLMAENVYKMDSANVQRFSSQKNGFTIDLTGAKPGDLVELGDVTGKNAKGIPAAPDRSDASDDTKAARTVLRGIVIDPAGKPLAGAAVHVRSAIFNEDDPPLASAVTDVAGRFEFSFRWPQFDERTGNQPNLVVVAMADGLAPDWTFLRKDESPREMTLNLPQEKAIGGRIVNEEGRPIAGVELKAETISRYDVETMKMMLDDVAQGRTLLRMGKTWHYGALSRQPARVITAADGRFRIGGLSSNTVVKLHVRGAGIRETRVNATTATPDTIRGPVPSAEPPYGPRAGAVLYGSQFDYVAEPGRRIVGTVRDRETKRPVAKANVMIYQPTAAVGGGTEVSPGGGNDRLSAETDDAGRYVIDGCAKNSRVGLNVDPPATGPAYFPAALPIEDAPGLAEVTQNVELVRGIELRGRIVDSETSQPLVASVQYAPLYLNKYAGPLYEQEANLRSHTRSHADGSFRLAVAPGPGAVAVSRPAAAAQDYMSVAVSYDDVVKLFEASSSHRELAHSPDLKLGLPDSLRTQGRGGWSLLGQTGEARVVLICPEEKTSPEPVEVRLVRGRSIRGKVVDADGQPLAGTRAYLNNPGIGYTTLSTAEFTVTALASGEKRDIAFRHDERRLGAFRTISADEAEALIVPLEPFASAQGRTLDEQGASIEGLHVWFYRAGHIASEEWFAITDVDGRFRIDKLIPNQPYEVLRTGPGSTSYRQFSAKKLVFSVGSGKTHELGDLIVKGPIETVSLKGKRASVPDGSNPPRSKKSGDSQTDAKGQRNREDHAKDASTTKPATEKIVHGRVLLSNGKPAVGAHLAVLGNRTAVARRGDRGQVREILSEATADEKGEYCLRLQDVSQKTHVYPRLIARQDGFAIAWRELNLDAVETQADFELKPEAPLRGRLVDIEGQPAAGVRLSIVSVVEPTENELQAERARCRSSDRASAAWIAPITSDEQGRFIVEGVAADQGVTLEVQGDDRFALQDIALNTGIPEERRETDGSYRPLVKNVKPGEEAVLAVAPAQVFGGTVRYADSGEPVPHARVSIWSSQQEFAGSMASMSGSADEMGRYHITPTPGIRFGVTAYPPAGSPYLIRQTSNDIPWKGGERVKEVDLTLPRGVLVRGTVVEHATGAAVVGATVQYLPESSNNRNASDDILTGWQCNEITDEDGRFTIAVLPGPGRLLVNGPKGKYVLREIGDREIYSGKPGGRRYYVHAIAKLDLEADRNAVEVKLELEPGETATGKIVDEAGNAVDEALVISRLDISFSPFWRGHTAPTLGGRFELNGLAEGVEYPVYFLDPKRRLGAKELIKAGVDQRTVVLKPCGTATLRLVDGEGEPMPANYGLFQMVVTPGPYAHDRDAIERGELAADADFIANIDRTNNPISPNGENGARTLKALIPGATYRVVAQQGGQIKIVKEFQVKPGETVEFGDITVER